MDLRLLTESDAHASSQMSAHAFGMPAADVSAFTLGPEVRRWGLFDGEVLAAKANERSYDSLIGGRPVPTAGVAGVAVAPEYRGTGLARQLMTHLLSTARDRGAVIATLFRTAPALYRSLGFEQVADLVHGSLPTAALRGIRPVSTTLRRATAADAAALHQVYRAVGSTSSCLLTREGASFETDPHADPISRFDGVTLAEDESGVVGYACWNRGTGYGTSAVLDVVELLATSGDAYRALLSAVAAFDAVTPTLHLRTSGDDPVHWLIGGAGWAVRDVQPYMLRVIDAAAAVAARGWPSTASVDTVIELEDPVCPWNSGRHRLRIAGGHGELVAAENADAGTQLDVRALAVLFAGGVPTAILRRAGLVTGGDAVSDAQLDAAFAGPRPAILDSFCREARPSPARPFPSAATVTRVARRLGESTAVKTFDDLFAELLDRAESRPAGSGTVAALDDGVHAQGKKLLEEAGEVWLAAEHESDDALALEISQLLYRAQVIMIGRGIGLEQVYRHL